MSAFVVDPKTINAIVTALQIAVDQDGVYPGNFPNPKYMKTQTLHDAVANPAELGAAMYGMNINAVEQRYPGGGDLPGTYTDGEHLDAYKYRRVEVSPIRVYKALSSYLYQCSEGDVFALPLYNALAEFKATLAEHMIENMPEYEKAEWG